MAGEIRFDGQVVVVTGGGRGIGRGHCLLFAERGAHVVVNDVDADVAQEVVDEIAAAGGTATAAPGDVVDDAAAIIATALGHRGRIDALVNNAGIALDKPFGPDAVAETERLLRVHALGTVAMTVAAWDALNATRGRIVNTTSNSVIGLANASAYAAAKGAVLGFTRSLALEPGAADLRVNAVMPMARTRMFEIAGGEVGSDIDQWMTANFPPEAIAPGVVYLASDEVPFTGQVIECSGWSAAHVFFATTPYEGATTPEAVRDGLADRSGPLTIVNELFDMHTAKMALS